MTNTSRPLHVNDHTDEVNLTSPEPTYLDRLYIQFGQGMTYAQHTKFQSHTRERKDYLFDLWLKKNGYV
jgi:hypothetical protein